MGHDAATMQGMQGAAETFVGTARYEVQGRLGDGGGGVVYRAYDRHEQREVALKVMRDNDGDGLRAFRATFASLRQIRHPNLVTLYDLTEERGRFLLAMELIEG